MTNTVKQALLDNLSARYGSLRKLEGSQSLYEIGNGAARIYIRYSKVHNQDRTFYGLREEDLRKLEGFPSVLCFLWDGQTEPLFIPFSEYEEIFRVLTPASDGQFKVQIYLGGAGDELYIASAGRFNIEGDYGWDRLGLVIDATKSSKIPELTHSQVQTLLGSIGTIIGCDIWVPQNDRPKLDWSLTNQFVCRDTLLTGVYQVEDVLQEIDVVWFQRGSTEIRALFEVEHSTPIYSGLLRFNDIHLTFPGLHPKFSVVANEERRSLFVRQLNRPTFQVSGLGELCTFMEYTNVYNWFQRLNHARNHE